MRNYSKSGIFICQCLDFLSGRSGYRDHQTGPPYRFDTPDNLSKVHFIKMVLTENGKVISENFYHRSLEENNYPAVSVLSTFALDIANSMRESPTVS